MLPLGPGTDLLHAGWREWVALPDLAVPRIKAKVDTGAATSALHAWKIELIDEAGRQRVRFELHPRQHSRRPSVTCVADLIDIRRVRSSSGMVSDRPVIVTQLAIGPWSWPIELTLIGRDEMGFRMLLGRQAIRQRLLVDSGRSFVLGLPAASSR